MSSEDRTGHLLASKYRLEALLGSGGMGHVYRATNELIGREVAIKLLKAEHATNPSIVDRFLREARAANLVRHPNVVDVSDIGQDADGSPFIVQELLNGEDLAHYAERVGGKLPLDEVVDLLCPVIDAVAEAHARGVIHRDLKPENIFLANVSGRRIPKLLDFGISKIRVSNVRATEVGMMMGTPAYMPPEQLQGAKDADARSDVWAMGIMLFELITGRLPFLADDAPSLFVAIATQDAPKLLDVKPDVSPSLSKIVERCLRRKPDERYPTASELARDLRLIILGREVEPTGRFSRPPSRLPSTPSMPKAVISSKTAPMSPAMGAVPELGSPAAQHKPASPMALRDTEMGRAIAPNAPDLDLPPPRQVAQPSSARMPAVQAANATPRAPGPASRTNLPAQNAQNVAPASDRDRAGPAAPSRLAPEAQMRGVMMAPNSPMSQRQAPQPYATPYASPHGAVGADRVDMSWLVGLAVVSLVTIGGLGALLKFASSERGWEIVRFLIQPSTEVNAGAQAILALVCAALGGTRIRQGIRHWRGDLAGGHGSAVINAVVASALFFAAVELARAAW